MTPDELRAEVERLTRDRDDARDDATQAWDRAEVLRNERDELHVAWKREREEVERLTRERDAEIASLTAALDERDVEAERVREQYDRLMHQLADKTNEATHWQVMLKRETEEVERLARQVEVLTDERDELLVRVADASAELRATREAYNGVRAELTRERIGIRPVDEVRSDAYRRGAEAMREACARVADAHCVPGTRDVIRALPIPGEP